MHDETNKELKRGQKAAGGIAPRFSIELHRGVYLVTPDIGTCEVVRASEHDAMAAANRSLHDSICDLIDKTLTARRGGMAHSDCLEEIKRRLNG